MTRTTIARNAEESQGLPPLLKSFERWTVLLFAVSVAFHLFCYFALHMHGHMVWPFSLNSHDRFYDFTIFTEKFRYFHTAHFFEVGFPINYMASLAVVFEFFFRYTTPHEVLAFVSFCVLSFLVPAALFARTLARRGVKPWRAAIFVAVLTLLSWPMLLIVDGANAEVVVWLAMLVAMWALATGREYLAAAFFGLAAAMKLFPFIFLALFLSRARMKQLLCGVATFFGVSVVSLALLGPTIPIAYRGINYGLSEFKRNYFAQWHTGENGVDHSMFAIVKGVLRSAFHHPPYDFSGWLRAYLLITVIGGLLLYFLVIRKQPLLNQVLGLSVAAIYFTPFSGDGTLIHLYYPLAMLFFLAMNAWRNGVEVPGLSRMLHCMVFCLSMESFLVVQPHNVDPQGARFIGPAHAIALGILLYTVLRHPLGPPLESTPDETILAHPGVGWLTR